MIFSKTISVLREASREDDERYDDAVEHETFTVWVEWKGYHLEGTFKARGLKRFDEPESIECTEAIKYDDEGNEYSLTDEDTEVLLEKVKDDAREHWEGLHEPGQRRDYRRY